MARQKNTVVENGTVTGSIEDQLTAALEAAKLAPSEQVASEDARVAAYRTCDRNHGAPTPESIAAHFTAALDHLYYAFHETEMRIMGDNGKLYPSDAQLPEGVEALRDDQYEDGCMRVEFQKYRFMQEQMASVICWKLETQITKNLEQQRVIEGDIDRELELIRRGKGSEHVVRAKAGFLDRKVEEYSMLRNAWNASREAFADLAGFEYETSAARQERKALEAVRPKSDLENEVARVKARMTR